MPWQVYSPNGRSDRIRTCVSESPRLVGDHCPTLRYGTPHKESNLEFIVRSDTVFPLAYKGIMVWTEGFEPPTACSQNRHAAKLHYAQIWLLRKDLHLHRLPYERSVLLFELHSINGASNRSRTCKTMLLRHVRMPIPSYSQMERPLGIEPRPSGWKPDIITFRP